MGVVYFLCRDLNESGKYFAEYLEDVSELGDTSRMVVALNNMSAWNEASGDSLMADNYARRAVDLCEGLDDSALYARTYLNMSSFLINAGRLSEAESYLMEVRPYLREDPEKWGHYCLNRYAVNMALRDTASAVVCLKEAVDWYGKREFEYDLLDAYSRLVGILEETGDVS